MVVVKNAERRVPIIEVYCGRYWETRSVVAEMDMWVNTGVANVVIAVGW